MDRSRLVRLVLAALAATLALAFMAVPAEAATVSINSFSVSPGRVTAAGGKITFTWNTSGAATCSISSDVHLNTLPANVACGRHSKAITLPGANSTSNKVFTFAFTARNGSLATTAKVRVTRNAIWPKVDALYKSIRAGATSDSLRVRASVRFARTCTLSVTPPVAGLPSSANCANGSYFKATSIPKNTSAADRTYNIKLSATSPAGVTVSRKTTIVQRGLGADEPSITRFGLTPSSLQAAGGTYTVTATVSHASTCSVTITPAVANPPAPVGCSAGTYSQKVTVPANTGSTAKSYSFTFTAANNVGSVSATIGASQPGAAPSISALKSSQTLIPAGGGDLTVSATLGDASSCTFTSTPAVSGLPTGPFPCTGSSFSRTVTVPGNSATSSRTFTFTLKATNGNGTATGTLSVTQSGTSAAQPVITTVKVTPSSADYHGGTFTLSGTTTNTSTCTFSSTPDVGSGSSPCTAGTFSKAFTIPANTTAAAISYVLKVVASGTGGSTNQTVTVTVPAAPPAISSFTSSPAVSAAGGSTTLTATLTRASTCTLTSSPTVTGLPAGSFDCASGSVSRAVTIPANTGSTSKSYVFTLAAGGNGGTATATLTLTQPGTGPAVTALAISPQAVTAAGGSYTVTATVTHASTCVLTSSPSFTGTTSPVDCSGGSFSRAVTLPANTTGSPIAYAVTLKATNAVGSATATLNLTQPAAPPAISSFTSTPASVGAAGGGITLNGTVARAATCVLSSSPNLGISATPFTCSGGTVQQAVTIPANAGDAGIAYTFTLKATGSGGTATATVGFTQPAALPVIGSYAANPASLTSAAATVTFTATIAHGTTCVFTPTASLGNPTTVSCSGASFSLAVAIPANTSGTTRTYTFTLKVTGPGGSATQTLTMTQPTASPSISNPTISPASLTSAGGSVTLGASLANTTSCTLTSTPDLGLSTPAFSCTGTFSRSVAIPANTTGSAKSYTITLKATGPGAGTATATYPITVPAAPPTLSNYAYSPTSIPAGGTTLTFTATVSHAATCTFTPSASLGSASTVDCTSGSFSKQVVIPANHSGATINYTFKLEVDNASGTAAQTYTIPQPSS